MTSLVQAFNNGTLTTNGMPAFKSTLNANLDFFYQAGASRGKDITKYFERAMQENEEVAIRTLLWLRDARQGAGERQQFRNLVVKLDKESALRVMARIPELGRWDDLLVFLNTPLERFAAGLIANGLLDGNGLAAKWMPRKGKIANRLRYVLGLTPKQYRKCLVELTNVVETQMCAQQWGEIEFGKVPSVAAGRYIKAFLKNCPEAYAAYKAGLVKGEEKINAGAVYPYDVVKAAKYGDAEVAAAQWAALPDYMQGATERILPMVDVSGSMYCPAGGHFSKSQVECIDVAISLGLYIAQRNEGVFKNAFLTFSESPKMQVVPDNFVAALQSMQRADWGMNTDIAKAFYVLLERAVWGNVPAEQMPTQVLILSDMQFDFCVKGLHVYDMINSLYEERGYKLPQIVFWNINSESGNVPVTAGTKGTALVSGFSPAILKNVIKGNLEPVKVMLDTVMVDRYNF